MTFPLTTAQIAANQVANNFSIAINQDLNTYRQRYNQVFKVATGMQGPNGPVQTGTVDGSAILSSLGTNAGAVLNVLAKHYAYLSAVGASLAATDALPAYTANPDGSVTLTNTSSNSGSSS